MTITATRLRQNLYRLLDQVLETGIPIEIERKGHLLRISTSTPPSKLDNLEERDFLVDDPDSYVHLDWTEEWRP